MANGNLSIKKSQQTNVIVVTEGDEAFQTIISLVQKSNNCDTSTNLVKRVVSVFKLHMHIIKSEILFNTDLRIECRSHTDFIQTS